MYRLQIRQLIIIRVDARAEEETRITTVDDLVVAKLDKVGLILLIAGRDEPVHLALELDFLVVAVGGVPFREAGLAPIAFLCVSMLRFVMRQCVEFGWLRGVGGDELAILDENERQHSGGRVGSSRLCRTPMC